MELKFRAVINPTTIIYFTLKDLVQVGHSFSFRELLIPRLAAGNQPDRCTGLLDQEGNEIYDGDFIQWRDPLNGGLQKGLIEFYNGSFGVKRGFTFIHLGNIYKSGLITIDGKDIRTIILGNQYGNPELLPNKTT